MSCSSLRTIEVGWDTPINAGLDLGSFAESLFHTGAFAGGFSFDYANSKLIVPPGTQGLYQSAPVWRNFGTIVEATLSTVPDTLSYEAGAADTTIVVEQAADSTAFDLSVNSIFFDAKTPRDAIVRVTSFIGWTVSVPASADWIEFDPPSPSPPSACPTTSASS